MGIVGWNDKYRVLVDQMGIMMPIEDVKALLELCRAHINEHSPLEREAIGWRTAAKYKDNIREDYFAEDSDGTGD